MPDTRVISTMMKPEELLNYLTSSTQGMFQIIQQGKEIIMMMQIFSHRLEILWPQAPSCHVISWVVNWCFSISIK